MCYCKAMGTPIFSQMYKSHFSLILGPQLFHHCPCVNSKKEPKGDIKINLWAGKGYNLCKKMCPHFVLLCK